MPYQTNIIIGAFLGFLISSYIRYKKIKQKKLVCLIGEDCNKVVYGRYASTLGIPNESIGMLYYGIIAFVFAVHALFPSLKASSFHILLNVATGGAALFSLYLVFIQIFLLKEWCEWCLASSILAIAIFFLVLISYI